MLAHSPKIVTNGLVFAYDMSNTYKSWKGRPVTNQFAIPTPDSSNNVSFQVQGNGIFERIFNGRYAGYDIGPNDVVYKHPLPGSSGCWYHGNDVTINAGQTATFSFDYYVDPSVTSYPVTNYLANFEGVVGGAIGDPTPTEIGVWKRLYFSSTAGSTGTCRMLLYPGACGGYLGTGGFVLFKNPQVEFDAPGNIPSPYVSGTRSNAQSLLDLTNRTTMTPSNLTYNSDNTFDFTYSSPGYITVPLSTAFNKTEGSMNFWVYPTRYNGGNGYFVNREDNIPNATDWFWIGPYSNTFYFRIGNGTSCCDNDLSFANVSTNVPLNTWTNMCFTWKANGTSIIYKNGVEFASRSIGNIPNTNPASNGRIGLGHANADDYFNGKMPIVQIYNRQLTAAEVNSNFNAMRGRYGI